MRARLPQVRVLGIVAGRSDRGARRDRGGQKWWSINVATYTKNKKYKLWREEAQAGIM